MSASQMNPPDSTVLSISKYPSGTGDATVGQLKQWLTAKGFNFACLVPSGGGYTICAGSIGSSVTDLYLADNSILETSYDYTVGYSQPQTASYDYPMLLLLNSDGNGLIEKTGVAFNFSGYKAVDNIGYYYPSSPIWSDENLPCTVITTFTGNIYYNNVLHNDWEWYDDLAEVSIVVPTLTGNIITWDKLLEKISQTTFPGTSGISYENSITIQNIGGDNCIDFTDLPEGEYGFITSYGLQISKHVNLYGSTKNIGANIEDSSPAIGYNVGGLCEIGVIRFAVNHVTRQGVVCLLRGFHNGGAYTEAHFGIMTDAEAFYTILVEHPAPEFDWEAVETIAGKNKVVNLSVLKIASINDGQAVSDGTANDFVNSPMTVSIPDILSLDLPIVENNPVSIALKYNIPELTDSTYTVCKVVAKKDKIPKSKTDGDKIIDISSTSHACTITGLEQETKYYVVIFVEDSTGNKAESDPKNITTGKIEGIFKSHIGVHKALIDNDFKGYATYTKQT